MSAMYDITDWLTDHANHWTTTYMCHPELAL